MPTPQKAHSEEQFGAQRDFWWNPDFLELMAMRWRLREASSLADIGCGLCHWSRLLYPYLRAPARLACVDREARWVLEAAQLFHRTFPDVPSDLLNFEQGDATRIPLADDAFDVVTCQTVLMHLAQPMDALREMVRILHQGGLLVCVEPNNFWNFMAFTSLTADEPVEVIVRRFEFWLRYDRGKTAAGEGGHTIGDLLPGYFAQLGLADIKVHTSDRAAACYPPYAAAGQQVLLQQERQWKESAIGPWDREALRRQILRGGGSAEFFDLVFGELNEKYRQEQESVAAGTFHAAFGGITYLVSGRKL